MNEHIQDVLLQCGAINENTKLYKVYRLHGAVEAVVKDCIEIIHRYKLESEQTGTYPHKVLDDIVLAIQERYRS